MSIILMIVKQWELKYKRLVVAYLILALGHIRRSFFIYEAIIIKLLSEVFDLSYERLFEITYLPLQLFLEFKL